MEKQNRKKLLGRRSSLPVPPPAPTSPTAHPGQPQPFSSTTSSSSTSSTKETTPDAIKHLIEYKEREMQFLKTLNENCTEKMNASSPSGIDDTECENYINPLLNITGPSVVAALATHDAFEQLNKLHSMLFQFLTIKEQNDRMRRNVRDLEMIYGLKKIQLKVFYC